MKTLILAIHLFLSAPAIVAQQTPHQVVKTVKTVKAKSQAVQTDYIYQYNFWTGKIVLVPDIKTVYYFTYTDNTTQSVSLELYNKIDIGGKVLVRQLK